MKRKAIPKSIRFEVLKRDSFTCQYCGRQAPEVILEIDHITPVAEGGDNDILNLVTSCRECNRGKGKKELSDNTACKKRKKQADETQARLEQVEMMSQWIVGMQEEAQKQIDILNRMYVDAFDCEFTKHGERRMKKWIKEFGFQKVVEAFEISLSQYDDYEIAFQRTGGIAYNRKKAGY